MRREAALLMKRMVVLVPLFMQKRPVGSMIDLKFDMLQDDFSYDRGHTPDMKLSTFRFLSIKQCGTYAGRRSLDNARCVYD